MHIAALLGFALGLVLGGWLVHARNRRATSLKDDEAYLLAAAHAAGGRLRIRRDVAPSGERLLVLKEFPNPRRILDRGQIGRLLAHGNLIQDPSGHEDHYRLTPLGLQRAQALPPFPLPRLRTGAWFNSLSRTRRRIARP